MKSIDLINLTKFGKHVCLNTNKAACSEHSVVTQLYCSIGACSEHCVLTVLNCAVDRDYIKLLPKRGEVLSCISKPPNGLMQFVDIRDLLVAIWPCVMSLDTRNLPTPVAIMS